MIRFALTALLLALMSACGSVPQIGGGDGQQQALPGRNADENPYLRSRAEVSEEAQQRFDAANVALAAEDWDTAQADLEWLVQNYPDLSGPYLNLALLHVARGDTEAAEPMFKAAIQANNTNLGAYNHYAVFLREQGRFEDAERAYLSALAVWDDHAMTHRNIGVLYDLYRGDYKKALEHYHRYQSLTGNEDRTVAGWIVLLERQFSQVVQRGEQR